MRYTISGGLPAPWEDFRSKQPGAPHVTIITEANRMPNDEENEAMPGWLVIFLNEELITEERAKEVLARVTNVTAHDIVIQQQGVAQAV